jgi:MraZ protein
LSFRGTYEHSLDDRGRIAIPSRYRDAFADGVVFVKSPDGCIEIYTPQAYNRRADTVLAGGENQRSSRRLQRSFFANSWDGELDKQGRVLVPQVLRTATGLNGSVTIVGRGECFELWDSRLYAEELSIADAEYDTNLERVPARERGRIND